MFGDVTFAQTPFASPGGSTFAAALSEEATTLDDSVAVFGIFIEIGESAGLSTSDVNVRDTFAEMVESAEIADLTLSQALYNPQVEEGAEISSAIFDSTQDSNVHVTGVEMSAIVTSVLVWGNVPDTQLPNWVLIPT